MTSESLLSRPTPARYCSLRFASVLHLGVGKPGRHVFALHRERREQVVRLAETHAGQGFAHSAVARLLEPGVERVEVYRLVAFSARQHDVVPALVGKVGPDHPVGKHAHERRDLALRRFRAHLVERHPHRHDAAVIEVVPRGCEELTRGERRGAFGPWVEGIQGDRVELPASRHEVVAAVVDHHVRLRIRGDPLVERGEVLARRLRHERLDLHDGLTLDLRVHTHRSRGHPGPETDHEHVSGVPGDRAW